MRVHRVVFAALALGAGCGGTPPAELHTIDAPSTASAPAVKLLRVQTLGVPPPAPPATNTTVAPATAAPVEPVPPTSQPAAAGGASNAEQIIRAVFGPEGDRAIRVATCESGLDPGATNGGHAGLFQLARRWHEQRAARLGYTWDQMWQPEPNARVAYDLWLEQGWGPWSCQP